MRIRAKDNLPFYSGVEKSQKLKELQEQALSHYREATAAWRGWLEHAREVGIALNEAKRINGGSGKWGRWLDKNFCKPTGLSSETARVYMRIAREWDGPRLTEARAQGVTLNSIESVRKVLCGHRERKEPSLTEKEKLMSNTRKVIRMEFAEKLRELDYSELKLLKEGFGHVFWPKMFQHLAEMLCQECGYDYAYEFKDTRAVRREKDLKKNEIRRSARIALKRCAATAHEKSVG